MRDNISIIESFYTAFAHADPERMIQYYHDEIRFVDPAFGVLHGEEAKDMWRMLVRPGIKITFHNVKADAKTGSADWIAEYAFGKTQRMVVNEIHAEFVFQDGKIIRHTDHFNLWKWSRQALGASGLLLGWTPWMKKKVRNNIRARLKTFSAKQK